MPYIVHRPIDNIMVLYDSSALKYKHGYNAIAVAVAAGTCTAQCTWSWTLIAIDARKIGESYSTTDGCSDDIFGCVALRS
jgi:hypothetical protein